MPDNRFATACDIGQLVGTKKFENSIGKRDKVDFYKLTLSSRSRLDLSLKQLKANTSLHLFSTQDLKKALARSDRSGNKSEQIRKILNPGTYYIKIASASRVVTRYSLSTLAAIVPSLPCSPGNTTGTACNLGNLSSATSRDSVGNFGDADYYKFTLPQISNFSSSIDSSVFTPYTDLYIDANTNGLIDQDEFLSSGSDTEPISQTLLAGTYFLKVSSFIFGSSYSLSLSATPAATPASYYYGYGLVDASAAVASAIGQAPFSDVPDSNFVNLWGLDKIKAPEVLAQGFDGQGVVVAVLDTGVDYFNFDLNDNIWVNADEIAGNYIDDDRNGYIDDTRGWDFTQNDNSPFDVDGHGTFVAGIVADSLYGVAPAAKVMSVKVAANGSAFDLDLADGIYYAVQNGADIINISYGGQSALDPELQQAIQFAHSNNVLVIAAAGNGRLTGTTQPDDPAFFSAFGNYGIAVGAIDRTGKFADFSNPAGNNILDYVVAPGVDVYSDDLYDSITSKSGTSFAAPYVAGVAALMLSANPNLTPSQVESILTATANPGGITKI